LLQAHAFLTVWLAAALDSWILSHVPNLSKPAFIIRGKELKEFKQERGRHTKRDERKKAKEEGIPEGVNKTKQKCLRSMNLINRFYQSPLFTNTQTHKHARLFNTFCMAPAHVLQLRFNG